MHPGVSPVGKSLQEPWCAAHCRSKKSCVRLYADRAEIGRHEVHTSRFQVDSKHTTQAAVWKPCTTSVVTKKITHVFTHRRSRSRSARWKAGGAPRKSSRFAQSTAVAIVVHAKRRQRFSCSPLADTDPDTERTFLPRVGQAQTGGTALSGGTRMEVTCPRRDEG